MCERMFLILFIFLLPLSSADYLEDHLNNNVDLSVDPCDEFFLHACSQSVKERSFPFSKINKFYESLDKLYRRFSDSRNLAIGNDIFKLRKARGNVIMGESKPIFNRTNFEDLLLEKCDGNDECIREEFNYYYDFYGSYTGEAEDRLEYFQKHLEETETGEILEVLLNLVNMIHDSIFENMSQHNEMLSFHSNMMNRLYVMQKLKKDGIFEKVVNIDEDLILFKKLIIEKFTKTTWMNEEDGLGLTLLREFEDTINNLVIHYDLDENDRDLELLRNINSKFAEEYYLARQRTSGSNLLDIHLSLQDALSRAATTENDEELMLIERVKSHLELNAFYLREYNRIAILAPLLYPELTDNATLNKHYSLFATIGHEIFHSVVRSEWAQRSNSYNVEMKCYHDHFEKACDIFGKGSCNSGVQTFEEDGADVEGERINYEFLLQNYDQHELQEIIHKGERGFTVNREQAFFYLFAVYHCETIKEQKDHTDVHSFGQVRVNGVMTQMPEFSKAFGCNANQTMFTEKGKTCNLFGPYSK